MTCFEMVTSILDWISANSDTLAVLVAAVSALIAAITAIAAFCSNRQNKKQYQESIQPQLSMSLTKYDAYLYLRIKNTGRLPAKEIKVTLKNLTDNGSFTQFDADSVFSGTFELYPEEAMQGRVAIYGRSLSEQVFPQISIDLSYRSGNSKKVHTYPRTVTYLDGYTETVFADVKMDASQRDNSLDAIKRAAVRVANYLDGRQLVSFDKLDILAGTSLRSDLMAASGQKEEPVMTREDTIAEAQSPKQRQGDGQKV